MKTLETRRLILRDWSTNDIGCEVHNESVIRYLISVKNNYAVVLKENGLVVGTIGLNEDADGDLNVRNVGIRMLDRYQNKGLMSEALECVIRNVSDITDTLSYFCLADDERSRHIAEKFGFKYIKTFRNVQRNPADEPKDFYYYRLKIATYLKTVWQAEEDIAHVHGWDFSHINDRYQEEVDLPWDYKQTIKKYLKEDMRILDYDTGGGEFLLSLGHSFDKTAATEGYQPNVELCKEKLLPLGIDFKACDDPANIPYESESFDMIINRHGSFDVKVIYRLLKKGGIFVTQQVGEDNDRELVKMVLPDVKKPFPGMNLKVQQSAFEEAGFEILEADEAFRSIKFYDIGAFVWFARIIEWEFPEFSVDRCFEYLMEMQKKLEDKGCVEGTTHRYLIVARK